MVARSWLLCVISFSPFFIFSENNASGVPLQFGMTDPTAFVFAVIRKFWA
jgi:hypothetical protein